MVFKIDKRQQATGKLYYGGVRFNTVTNVRLGGVQMDNLTSVDSLTLKLATLSNRDLVGQFEKTFKDFSRSPANEGERAYILEVSRRYVDEFKARIKKADFDSRFELAKLLQIKMRLDDTPQPDKEHCSYYTNTLLRLYVFVTRRIEDATHVDASFVKKELK